MSYKVNIQIPHFVRNDDPSNGEINGISDGFTVANSVSSLNEILSFRRSEATEKTNYGTLYL